LNDIRRIRMRRHHEVTPLDNNPLYACNLTAREHFLCVFQRAIMVERAIRTALALLGLLQWAHDDRPDNHLESLDQVALRSITAEHNEEVPLVPTRHLHGASGPDGSALTSAGS
jgi:hypothetical protein